LLLFLKEQLFCGQPINILSQKRFLTQSVKHLSKPHRILDSLLLTAKVAIRNKKIGELGFSYMGGVYNKFQEDGLVLDEKRRHHSWALDFNTVISSTKTYFNTEWVFNKVDVPPTYGQQYGDKQVGGFLDVVQPIVRKNIFGFDRSVINAVCRFEYVDWNVGEFAETGEDIAEYIVAVVPGISWRPNSQTVIRFNYRYNWQTDLLGNPASKTAGFQFGFSSYF